MNSRPLRIPILIINILLFSGLFSQNNTYEKEFKANEILFYKSINKGLTDSSLQFLKRCERISESQSDSNLIHSVYLQKASYYKLKDDYVNVSKFVRPALGYFERNNQVENLLEAADDLTSYYFANSIYDSSIFICEKYIPIAIKSKNNKSISLLLYIKGKCLSFQGRLNEATVVLREGLKFSKETHNEINIVQCLLALSAVYLEVNAKFALSQLNEAKKFIDKVGNDQKYAFYTSFGNTYRNLGNYDSALYFYTKILPIINKENNKTAYGATIGNIGNVYADMGRYAEALAKQFESIEYFKMSSDSLDIEIAYGSIADVYLQKKDYKQALNYLKKATAMSQRLGFVEELIYNYTGLFQCYENLGNYKEAFESYKLYHKYNDSIRNTETAKKLTEQELNYRFDERKKEDAIVQKSKDEMSQQQLKHQKLISYISFGGGIILLSFLFITMRNSNIRKKINQQLEISHFEIKTQKNIIETKNREITDSITYASRLQQGILPDADEVKELLPGSFIFYRPRDIVSGDFYWVRKLSGSAKVGTKGVVGIVIADCTGHGVPGAFMSFIGSTILNQTIGNKKVQSPGDALEYLNEQLPNTLQSKTKTGQINDGMEAGICVLNKPENKLFFSGANLNLIHIRNGIVKEIKGDKHPIGLNIELQKTFTTHEISLEKNDCVYMFSDGYPDQFGGAKGKKFKYKNLVNLLVENSSLNADEQLKLVSSNFDSWKGKLEQLDDVLMFGIKI